MAVIFDEDKAFLHIPKTAGMWVRSLLKENGIDYLLYSPQEYDPERIDGFMINGKERHHIAEIPDGIPPQNVFCIFRDPVSWYESFWLFRNYSEKWRWSNTRPLDAKISRSGRMKFQIFIDEMMQLFPDGFLSELYKQYAYKAGHFVQIGEKPIRRILRSMTGHEISKVPPPINTRRAGIERCTRTRDLILDWESKAEQMWRNSTK